MKAIRNAAILAILMVMVFSTAASADSYLNTISMFRKSPEVRHFFNNCYGYAVFPTVGKGGIVIGGAYGEGKVYRKGKVTGTASLAKISVGFQLGGQAFSEIIFFQDQRAYNDFTSGDFAFDASASAVAITAGAQASASTAGNTAGASAGPATGTQARTTYTNGMAVFIHAKGGLMYEATIGGQKFSFKPL
jgi:lipid-binding SYLF domain-containing protein